MQLKLLHIDVIVELCAARFLLSRNYNLERGAIIRTTREICY